MVVMLERRAALQRSAFSGETILASRRCKEDGENSSVFRWRSKAARSLGVPLDVCKY